ncbi:MAG: thiamine diphosphokinase [Victivallaceae bacterium]|nr:thiamine diphosphokinase [Victivallaceae bacterium]
MEKVVIIANGEFPSSERLLDELRNAKHLICCDGALAHLAKIGVVPEITVGDFDSIPCCIGVEAAGDAIHIAEQDDNDLEKALKVVAERFGLDIEILVLGAGGKREDHLLGNISRIADAARRFDSIRMTTNYGTLIPLPRPGRVSCKIGQAVSIINPEAFPITVTASGVQYPVEDLVLDKWHTATLNMAIGNEIGIKFTPNGGTLLIYLAE